MARKRLAALPTGEPRTARSPALGAGLHGVTIEIKSERSFQVRTAAGERMAAVLGDGVAPDLVDECLRTGRLVIAVDTPRGPTIVGALQTSVPFARDVDGVLTVEAKELRMRFERAAFIEVGPVTIAADASGVLRLEGDRMVIDMGALLRVLSAKVELP